MYMNSFLLGKMGSNKIHAIHDFGYKQTIFISACCKDLENVKIIDGNPNDITCGLCLTKLWDALSAQQIKIISTEEYNILPLED